MKKLLSIAILLILINCQTTIQRIEYTPIIIHPIPKIHLDQTNDIIDDYKQIAEWKVNIISYIKELLNQIKSKVPYKEIEN